MDPAQQRWLQQHPFLAPLAHFTEVIGKAAADVPVASPALPAFDAHAAAYRQGVALLRGETHGPALAAAASDALAGLAARAAAASLPTPIAQGVKELSAAIATPEGRAGAVAWLVAGGDEASAPMQAGLLRFLGWTAFRRILDPISEPFAAWRDDDAWHRPQCPTCGQLPVMAQLVGKADARSRVLVCGCCPTRWGYKRLGCPYCGNEAEERLALLELQGPVGLRLDVCESCKSYLKTYAGQGEEALFLQDWPTLLLDAMAAERGYARRGASLYDL
jgi:FdhE protein